MSNNDKKYDYTKLPHDKLNDLSSLFLFYHVDCLRKQRDMNLTDNEIPCNMLFNEHFKYFRRVSELHDKSIETKK
jgi:hypothetical protein